MQQELDNILSRYENAINSRAYPLKKWGFQGKIKGPQQKQAKNIRVMYPAENRGKGKIEITDADVETEIRKIAADITGSEAMIKQAKAQDNWDALRGKTYGRQST